MQKSDRSQIREIPLKVDQEESILLVRQLTDRKFAVCSNHRILIYSESWEEDQVINLPRFLIEKIARETEWDDFKATSIFTGYDISDDLKKIVYGDEEGLKVLLLGEENPDPVLLEESEAYPESDLSPISVYVGPRFVDESRKIFVTRSGYEGNRGIGLYDFQQARMTRMGHGWAANSEEIRPDQGLLIPNEFYVDDKTGQGGYHHYYVNFRTGELEVLALEPAGTLGDLPEGGEFYHGEQDLALLVKKYDASGRPGTTIVQRIDLDTGDLIDQTEIPDLRIRIAGVDRHGNIYVHYKYNQASQGFGLILAEE